MDCEECDKLLALYKHAVKIYLTAERSWRGLVGDDLRLALEKQLECRDAVDVLSAQRRKDH
jgi:hypothetical protein